MRPIARIACTLLILATTAPLVGAAPHVPEPDDPMLLQYRHPCPWLERTGLECPDALDDGPCPSCTRYAAGRGVAHHWYGAPCGNMELTVSIVGPDADGRYEGTVSIVAPGCRFFTWAQTTYTLPMEKVENGPNGETWQSHPPGACGADGRPIVVVNRQGVWGSFYVQYDYAADMNGCVVPFFGYTAEGTLVWTS